MSESKWVPMTADQKLDLARDVVKLVERQFPAQGYDGQADALVIALESITSVAFARTLLGSAG